MAKHEIICKELRTEIATGHFAKSGRLPSESQLVERFGVSRPTVARALRDLQNEGLIYRRAGSGTFVNHGSSGDRATSVLGILVPERELLEICSAICGELGALARVHGYGLLWGGSPKPFEDRDASPEHALEVCHQFIEQGVDGVFFGPMGLGDNVQSINREIVELLSQAGIPVVLLDRDIHRFPARSQFDLVAVDNFSGGFMMAEHMIRLGCRQLRFLARDEVRIPPVEGRLSGIRDAMLRHGLTLNKNLAVYGDPADLKFVRKLLAGNGSDCILCANDKIAAELVKTLIALKIKVPDQMRISGFDDIYASLCSVPLTTIHQPCREIADVAFGAMQERIREPGLPPRAIRLIPRLVVRESCGTYKVK